MEVECFHDAKFELQRPKLAWKTLDIVVYRYKRTQIHFLGGKCKTDCASFLERGVFEKEIIGSHRSPGN